MRINKFIASCSNISRRNADSLIKSGKIKVNGKVVTDFIDINPDKDIVELDGQRLYLSKTKLYFAFYKPPFVLSATKDDTGKAIVCDYFKNIEEKLICVGRLDYLSEGILIVTNDGDFANKLMHPKFKIKKTYLIKTKDPVDRKKIDLMSKGIRLDDGFFKPIKIKQTKDPLWVLVSINTGRNRILRRFFNAFDIPISKLKRISIGNIELKGLNPGEYREISPKELEKIEFLSSNN